MLGCLLLAAYYSISASFAGGNAALGAALISLFNAALPEVNRALVTFFEQHHDTGALESSFLAKTIAARCFISTIILYMVGITHVPQMANPYYIGSIQSVLLSDALTSPLIRILDLSGNLNRYVLAPLATTDTMARALNMGTDYLLGEWYTNLAKVLREPEP